jgi:hypothetical protein
MTKKNEPLTTELGLFCGKVKVYADGYVGRYTATCGNCSIIFLGDKYDCLCADCDKSEQTYFKDGGLFDDS